MGLLTLKLFIGFVKQMNSSRSLAPIGVRDVERVVQMVSSTTHSYTVMPIIFADGKLAPTLFVVLQEPKGRFPQNFVNTTNNLSVHCHTSHIMTKELMKVWLQEIFNDDMPDNLLMLLDSWTSFKDHETIQSFVPEGKQLQIRNIPPGATSMIQPLDVFFFRMFKGFVRRIHAHVMACELDFKIHLRENLLRVLEVVYNQFCNPIFRPFLQYSWYKCGYIEERPEEFNTPVQSCFPANVVQNCQCLNCENSSFVLCSYCNNYLCFEHFIVNKHYHDI